jgi:succinoglycan biosynthesis transport protein ExoP
MTDSNELHLSDYLAILRRRKKPAIVVGSVIFIVSLLVAMFWPPVYRSTATILIERQIPRDLVQSTVAGYASERIQIIAKRALTRDNLMRIAQQVDLFPDLRKAGDTNDLVERMRKGVLIDMRDAQVNDVRDGTPGKAQIAFELSYEASTPEAAENVAKELVALFVAENVRIRTGEAEGASEFLGQESQRLSQKISELEAKLAEYKARNVGRLPELMNMNMTMLDRSQRESDETERSIYALEERKLLLQSQLAQVEPYAGNSPGGHLKELETQYLSASSIYSPDHPDVVRLRREIASLKRELGVTDERAALEEEYKKVRSQLSVAEQKYGPDHPDVTRLKKMVAAAEARLAKTKDPSQLGFTIKPDNPAYISLKTQLDTVDLNLKEAKERRMQLQKKAGDYENRIVQTPRVEQEGLALQRDYDNAVKKFRELKDKELQAGVAEQLEKESLGERFSVIEPPQRPTRPERPNRPAIILLGLMFSLGGGIGYASYAEYMDRTVRGSRSVLAVLRAPPLALIPDMSPRGDMPSGGGTHAGRIS